MPSDSRLLPTLILFVSMPKSVVMILVSAFEMFPRSICSAKNASPRIGSKMKSSLISQHINYANARSTLPDRQRPWEEGQLTFS